MPGGVCGSLGAAHLAFHISYVRKPFGRFPMIVWLRRSRVLRLLLAVFLVPLIIVTSSNTARASEALASNVLTINTDVNFTGISQRLSNPECIVQVDALPGALRIHTGYCEVGQVPDYGCEILEPACTAMTVEYRGAGGCVMSQPVHLDRYQDGWFTNRVYISSPVRELGACQVQEVCVVIRAALPQWPDATFTGCEALGMEVPVEAPVGECPYGLVTLRDISDPIDLPGGSGYSPRQMVRDVTFDVDSDVGGWRAYALVRDHAGGYRYWDATNSAYDQTKTPPEAIRLSWSQMDGVKDTITVRVNTADEHDYNAPSPPETRDIIGVGVFRNTNGYDHHGVPDFGTYPLGLERLGVTDPAVCAFYWGDEVWDDGDPDGGMDEPLGPLPEDYVPDVDITLPEDLDVVTGPDSEGGFWAAVVDALARIIKALSSLAGAIAKLVGDLLSGLGALLKSLFIPSDGFLDDGVGELRDQANDSNIGEWNDAFSGLFSGGASGKAGAPAVGGESLTGRASVTAQSAPSGLDFGGGGCQGPSIDIARIIPEGMGSEMDTIHPFSACEGITAEMAGWSRLLSSLFLALFGGFKMFGYVASASFGMKQTEILRKFDWESDRLDGRSM